MSLSPRSRDRIVWLATVFVSALIIWVGHAQVMEGLHIFPDTGNVVTEGRVLSVDDEYVEEYSLDDVTMVQTTTVLFTCELLDGEHQGEVVSASQNIDELYSGDIRPVQAKDKIILYYNDYAGADGPAGGRSGKNKLLHAGVCAKIRSSGSVLHRLCDAGGIFGKRSNGGRLCGTQAVSEPFAFLYTGKRGTDF